MPSKTKVLSAGAIAAVLAAGLIAGDALAQRKGRRTPIVGVHVVQLPVSAEGDQGKQVSVVLETPRVKIATITLRKGTVLPTHSAPHPITIQSLSGTGTLRANGKDFALQPGVLLALAPDQKHEVTPAGKGDLVLLVHYMKARPGRRAWR